SVVRRFYCTRMDDTRGGSASADECPGSLPAGLRELAPGAELESVDHASVDGEELADLLHARARQLWHLQAESMVDLYLTAQWIRQRIGVSEPPKLARRHVYEYVAWRLRCSTRYAQSQLELAESLLTQFPQVFEEVSAGRLDPARAR